MEDKKIDDALRDLCVDGSIKFTIKANNTLENAHVHEEFKSFCKAETNNDYTQGIRKLLDYYVEDYKFSILAAKIEELEVKLNKLLTPVEKKQKKIEEDNEVF